MTHITVENSSRAGFADSRPASRGGRLPGARRQLLGPWVGRPQIEAGGRTRMTHPCQSNVHFRFNGCGPRVALNALVVWLECARVMPSKVRVIFSHAHTLPFSTTTKELPPRLGVWRLHVRRVAILSPPSKLQTIVLWSPYFLVQESTDRLALLDILVVS